MLYCTYNKEPDNYLDPDIIPPTESIIKSMQHLLLLAACKANYPQHGLVFRPEPGRVHAAT